MLLATIMVLGMFPVMPAKAADYTNETVTINYDGDTSNDGAYAYQLCYYLNNDTDSVYHCTPRLLTDYPGVDNGEGQFVNHWEDFKAGDFTNLSEEDKAKFACPSELPNRDGFTFTGWYHEPEAINAVGSDIDLLRFDATAEGNVATKIYAGWQPNQYKVTYDAPKADVGTVPAQGQFTYGEAYTIDSTEPTRPGCTFVGWDYNGDGVADCIPDQIIDAESMKIPNDVTLTAVWDYNALIGGGSFTTETPSDPLVEGVNFELAINATEVATAENGVVTVAKAMTTNGKGKVGYFEVDVMYDADGAGPNPAAKVLNAKLSKPVEVKDVDVSALNLKDGTYPVLHWNGTGFDEPIQGTVAGGMLTFETDTFSPFALLANPVTVTFMTGKIDGTAYVSKISEDYVESGDQVYAPFKAMMAGYDLKWYTDAACTTEVTLPMVVTADTTLYAGYTTKAVTKHTVTYTDGVTDDLFTDFTEKVTSGENYSITNFKPEREGYVFKGWKSDVALDTTVYTAGQGYAVTADVTMTAVWEQIPTTHTVTFNGNAADAYNIPAAGSVVDGGDFEIKAEMVAKRTNYVFKGWATTASAATPNYAVATLPATITGVTADVTLYAVWDEVKVTIENKSGSLTGITVNDLPDTSEVAINSKVKFHVIMADGYDHASVVVTANGVPLGAVKGVGETYYYEFTATEDTEVVISQPKLKSFDVVLPYGSNFAAAFVKPAVSASSTKVEYNNDASDVDYSFKITPVGNYTVKKVSVNGTEVTANASGVYEVTTVTSEQNIYVEMEEVVFYTVTYVTPTSMIERQVQKDTDFSAIAIGSVKIDGYDFMGWCTDAACTAPVTTGAKVTADMTVYGQYVAQKYEIQYDLNGGTAVENINPGSIDATTKVFGKSATLSEVVPTSTNYDFKGWATSATGPAVYQPGDNFSAEAEDKGAAGYSDEVIKLYAVWEVKKVHVTLVPGAGVTAYAAEYDIPYGNDFEFTVIVERDYAATLPTLSLTPNTFTLSKQSGAPANNAAATYTYKVEEVNKNLTINISATQNAERVVSFKYDLYDHTGDITTAPDGEIFDSQKVEHGYYAVRPATPVLEGYTFVGWFTSTGTAYNFDTIVIEDMAIFAKMMAIEPKVELPADDLSANGWWVSFTKATNAAAAKEEATVAYKAEKNFYLFVADGYDATNMQISANGYKLAPIMEVETVTGGKVYTFELYNITEDIEVTVSGIVRKTVMVTYNQNALDDVSGMPTAHEVNYYLAGKTNSELSKLVPKRVGYEFLGWNTDPAATAATHAAGAVANFTVDTTLYAIWQAKDLDITLTFDSEFKFDSTSGSGELIGLDYFYEGDQIALVGTLTAGAQGTMTFYKMPYKELAGGTWQSIGTVTLNGGKVGSMTTTVEPYQWDSASTTAKESNYRWIYKVEFEPTAEEGYEFCTSQDDIRVYSKAISWDLNKTAADSWTIADKANELKIYADNSGAVGAELAAGETMEANNVYWLEIPDVVEMDGGRVFAGLSKQLTVGEHYVVEWQYKDANNDWVTYTTVTDSDFVKVEAAYAQYSFRALVKPATSSIYTKAAKYDGNTVAKNAYVEYLITEPTAPVDLKDTTTVLDITGADKEAADVMIGGANDVFTGDHDAQFEGQKVTLTATVTEYVTSGTGPAVEFGSVEFYQNGKLIATVPVETAGDNTGKASCEAEINAFTGTDVTSAKDLFYAKYVANETYDTSDSSTAPDVVYIKSTKIAVPSIESEQPGAGGKHYTTDVDLDGLKAGIEHKFELVDDANTATAATEKRLSVVAEDGRSVEAENYTIQWWGKVGDNEEADLNAGSTTEYVVTDSKKGDYYYVVLLPAGDMTKGNQSNKVKIGTKQDVTVVVEASDEIAATTETDVYQLNPITLTATVVGAENPTMKPSGNVTFYYSEDDGTTWKEIGTAELKKADVSGEMVATIETTVLPVDANGKMQEVKITAIYAGDNSFNKSGTIAAKEITHAASVNTDDVQKKVKVYSSVVYTNKDIENTTNAGSDHNHGIYIRTESGKILANETNVNLMLSKVYTMDHDNALAELAFGTDFTVQWQKLSNAAAYASAYKAVDTPWTNIEGATDLTCQIAVEDGAAYRAVITVKNGIDVTPIVKGSATEVKAPVEGRKVYWSNILVASDAPATVTVNVNTNNVADGFEGIVEGEKVTIHTFTSGAVGTTPISELTMTITKGGTEVEKQTKDNVNGHVSFDWDTTNAGPGYYTMTVNAKFTNGYSDKTITRTLIVRDKAYELAATKTSKFYNGKAQGIDWTLTGMDIENGLAQKSVVVHYYADENRTQMVEPTQAGTYYYDMYLPESAYWTEFDTDELSQHVRGEFTIERRALKVEDLVAQTKVYDGKTEINELEIVLNDSAVNGSGVATGDTGIINGDSVYAIGTMIIDEAKAGTQTLSVGGITICGDDKDNYVLGENVDASYTEDIVVQRSQLKGGIAKDTYAYTGSMIKIPTEHIVLIDQSGRQLNTNEYKVTYYYHNGDGAGIKTVAGMKDYGMYTVVVTPNDTVNYKGGIAKKVYVADADGAVASVEVNSALINITNTVELYGKSTGAKATATVGNATVKYWNGTGFVDTVPTDAGRYMVEASVTNGTVTDKAYGIYTIVKANPVLGLTATGSEYTSAQITGTPALTGAPAGAEIYYTYTGGTIQGVAYEAPTEVGKYVVTAHIGETANYTAHEVSANFEITKKALEITADSLKRHQYGAYPDMTASFKGLATGGVAVDTSLRDVQIQPELVFDAGYTNNAADQVGNYSVTPVAALARNYKLSYVSGNIAVTAVNPNPELAIHGMIDNANAAKNIAYYGDKIQLYPYGSQKDGVINNSSVLTWSVDNPAVAEITPDGLLTVKGVGTFTVKLERGQGAQKIETTMTITAEKQEVKAELADLNLVYTGSARNYQTNVTPAPYAVDGKLNTVGAATVALSNIGRTKVGSQIVTGKVDETNYVSEIYGGLFTINDKDVEIQPNEQSVDYGDTLAIADNNTVYAQDGKVGSVEALIGRINVASVRELYNNLDVANAYEILVAGEENINYNVKYQTNPAAKKVIVDERDLTITTGVYKDMIGQTSGSLNPVGEYPVNGVKFAAGDLSKFNQNTTRMYGAPNQVMGYVLDTLVAGDSEADMTALIDWLVKYDFNIAGHASSVYGTLAQIIPANYDSKYASTIATKGQIVDSTMDLVNYNVTIVKGTQDIYQRPVLLECNISAANKELPKSITSAELKNILIQNITASEYSAGVGGLATLLKHTVADLDLKVSYQVSTDNGSTWTSVADFTSLSGYNKVRATITVGNPDYYAEAVAIEFTVSPTRYIIEIVNFGQTSASVNLYEYNEDTHAKTLTWFPADSALAVGAKSTAMTCKIYNRIDGATKYADYTYETPVVNAKMVKGYSVGRYEISYSALYGSFRMFAIADGYIIIDNN